MPGFDHFSADALRFLTDLKANNSREWFAARRKIYETEVRAPAKAFAATMAEALEVLTGEVQRTKIYRINRDIRFSSDKTPYNAHIHVSFAPETSAAQPPMWFVGLSPERLTVGCGVFRYDKDNLPGFRAAMASAQGAALMALAARLSRQGLRISEPDLKRIPPGFDKDHPHADALRRKGFSGWRDLDTPARATQPGFVQEVMREMQALLPIHALLSGLDVG